MNGRRLLRKRVPTPRSRLWAPADDPAQAEIEDAFTRLGFQFLARLYGAVLGRPAPRSLQKAMGLGPGPDQKPPGWGELARLLQADGPPETVVASWQAVVDRLVENLLPGATQAEAARRMALQAHLVGRLQARTAEGGPLSLALGPASRLQEAALAWTRVRAASAIRELDQRARREVVQVLLLSRQAGEGIGALQQRLFDRFSNQNRDWRRVALTETAAAVAQGSLAAIDPEEGWEVEWLASPTACPNCRRWHGQRFRVVSPATPHKDGTSQVWLGKTNEGRSAAARTRGGQRRPTSAQLWPALPCHPSCRCRWVLQRVKQPSRARPQPGVTPA